MRVTPSMPSPRGSLSTTSHFNSQAQTPIQGTAQGAAVGEGGEARDVVLVHRPEAHPESVTASPVLPRRLLCSFAPADVS